jgi:hypothetical protein
MRTRCWGGLHTGPLKLWARGGAEDTGSYGTAASWRFTAAIVCSWASRRVVSLGALAVHSHSQEVFPCIHGPVTGILIVLDAIPALRWRLRWDRRRLVRALPGVLRAFSYPLLVTTQGIKRKRGEGRRSAGGVPAIKRTGTDFQSCKNKGL